MSVNFNSINNFIALSHFHSPPVHLKSFKNIHISSAIRLAYCLIIHIFILTDKDTEREFAYTTTYILMCWIHITDRPRWMNEFVYLYFIRQNARKGQNKAHAACATFSVFIVESLIWDLISVHLIQHSSGIWTNLIIVFIRNSFTFGFIKPHLTYGKNTN